VRGNHVERRELAAAAIALDSEVVGVEGRACSKVGIFMCDLLGMEM
jgi:hypothetical protein